MSTGNPLPFTIQQTPAPALLNYGNLAYYYTAPPSSLSGFNMVATTPINVPPQPPGTWDLTDDGSGTKAYWPIGCAPPCTTCHVRPCGSPPLATSGGTLALSSSLMFGVREVLTPPMSGFTSLLVLPPGASQSDVLEQIENTYTLTNSTVFHVYALDPSAGLGAYIVVPIVPLVTDLSAALATFFA